MSNAKNENLNVLSKLVGPDPVKVRNQLKAIEKRQNEIIKEMNVIAKVEEVNVKQSYFIKDIKAITEVPGWIACSL